MNAISGIGLPSLSFNPSEESTQIMTVAILAISLAGSFFLYRLMYRQHPMREHQNIVELDKKEAIQLGNQVKVYAYHLLKSYPSIPLTRFTGHYIHPDIFRLVTIHNAVCTKNFIEALQKYPNSPWEHHTVIRAADELMKISYAISRFTIEDLPTYTNKKTPYVEALTRRDSYQCTTFFYCSMTYHCIRGQIQCKGTKLAFPLLISKRYEERFYQSNTLHYIWRTLYNDFCQGVRIYVSDHEFESRKCRLFVNWTQSDFNSTTFHRQPDASPI